MEDQLKSNNEQVTSELDSVKKEFEFSKTRFEENIMQKKSYNHILNRLKVLVDRLPKAWSNLFSTQTELTRLDA